jgi:Ca2+-binding RTX toxin-like protein
MTVLRRMVSGVRRLQTAVRCMSGVVVLAGLLLPLHVGALGAGDLDTSFGGDGKVDIPFGSGSEDPTSALAIQSRDGRLVVAGQSWASGGYDFALARFHAITCNGVVATRVGTAGNDVLIGTVGNDVIVGFDGNDTIYGLGGNDLPCGNVGNDTLIGDTGDDTLVGGDGTDVCSGGAHVYGDTASGCEQVSGVPSRHTSLSAAILWMEEACRDPAGTRSFDYRYGGKTAWKGSSLARHRSRS